MFVQGVTLAEGGKFLPSLEHVGQFQATFLLTEQKALQNAGGLHHAKIHNGFCDFPG
jgi:hypothetical protein